MKEDGKNGFTLSELLVGLGVIIALFVFYFLVISQVSQRIKVRRTEVAITQYATLLDAVRDGVGYYPPAINRTLESLTYSTTPAGYKRGWGGPYLKKIPIDPWKTPYFYYLQPGIIIPPMKFTRSNPPSAHQFFTFDAGIYAGPGMVLLDNFGFVGGVSNRVWLNGVEVVHPDEFRFNLPRVEKDATLLVTGNLLEVQLLGPPSSYIYISIGSLYHPKTTYRVGSYGKNKKPGGTGFDQDLTWFTGQTSPTFH